jgi:hypothetical protein
MNNGGLFSCTELSKAKLNAMPCHAMPAQEKNRTEYIFFILALLLSSKGHAMPRANHDQIVSSLVAPTERHNQIRLSSCLSYSCCHVVLPLCFNSDPFQYNDRNGQTVDSKVGSTVL